MRTFARTVVPLLVGASLLFASGGPAAADPAALPDLVPSGLVALVNGPGVCC